MSYKNLYQERLLEHFNHSAYKGSVNEPTFSTGITNPSCGDSIVLQGKIIDGVLTECRFQSQGCVISGAAASLLCQKVQGQSIEILKTLTAQTMLDLIGVPLGPTRLRCALLVLEALQEGIKKG